jgi:predicted DsbA family dithiol-disulfide isomerase
MRDHLAADRLIFDLRSYPRELAGQEKMGVGVAQREVVALAQLEPAVFSALPDDAWPTSNMPALEAQKWGLSLGQEIGESFDLALRRAVFLHGHNLALRSELLAVAEMEGLPADRLGAALDDGRYRNTIAGDLAEAQAQGIDGSPVFVLPDGTSHFNPGMTHRVERGIPLIISDHPSVYEELVQVATVEE